MTAGLLRCAIAAAVATALTFDPASAYSQTQNEGRSDGQGGSGVSVETLAPLDTEREQTESLPGERVTLRAIDKLTGEVTTLEVAVGEEVEWERLRIAVDACFARIGGRAPESSVFMRIFDKKIESEIGASFSGWMFSSSPALSAMDHSRYDVWVLNCAIS